MPHLYVNFYNIAPTRMQNKSYLKLASLYSFSFVHLCMADQPKVQHSICN